MFKDYYNILEISPNATIDEIRIAYKKLAKKYHPDLNHTSNSEEKMKEINEAYEQIMNNIRSDYYKNNSDDLYSEEFNFFSELYKYYKNKNDLKIDFNRLNVQNLYIGDICIYKYKLDSDDFIPFREQVKLKILFKNAILLKVGFGQYINLSDLKTLLSIKLCKGNIPLDKFIIYDEYSKPFEGEKFIKYPKKLNSIYGEYTNVKELKKVRKMQK